MIDPAQRAQQRANHATHTLYEPGDFTNEDMDRRNQLAIAVVEGGLGVCKRCAACEAELDDFSCAEYQARKPG